MAQYPVGPRVTQIWAGNGPVLLANQDLVNPVTVGTQQNVSIDASNTDVIQPLGAIAYTGETPLYAIAPANTAALLAITGGTSWAPSPAQVALQIQALGLAKDTTVAAIPAGVGALGLALDTTMQATKGQLITGVPPAVANVASAMAIGVGPGASPDVVFTFPTFGRVWGACLAGVVESTSGSSNARAFVEAQIDGSGIVGSGTPLAVLELAAMNQLWIDSATVYVPFNGLPVSNGTKLYLIVNGGTGITGATITASVIFFYSTP